MPADRKKGTLGNHNADGSGNFIWKSSPVYCAYCAYGLARDALRHIGFVCMCESLTVAQCLSTGSTRGRPEFDNTAVLNQRRVLPLSLHIELRSLHIQMVIFSIFCGFLKTINLSSRLTIHSNLNSVGR